jgi:hypothetical protein
VGDAVAVEFTVAVGFAVAFAAAVEFTVAVAVVAVAFAVERGRRPAPVQP